MAKIHTLIDDFQDGVIDAALWDADPGVTETGGRLKITPSTSFPTCGTDLPRTHDLTASQATVHVPVITSNGSTGTLQSGFTIDKDSNNYLGMRKVGSDLVCTKRAAGIETNLSFTLYSSVNHLFWRIRADASNVYFETSATGSGVFFIQHTESLATLGFAINVVGCYFFSGYSGIEAFPGTFQIESINPGLPITASGASTSTGSLAFSITGPVQLTASGASTSSGSLSMLAVSDLDLTGSATSTSTGSLDFTIIPAGTLNLTASGASTSTGSLIIAAVASGQLSMSGASTSTGSLSFSVYDTVTGAFWYFRPPIAYDNPPTLPEPTRPRYINAHARWKSGQARGRNVLKENGVYTTYDSITVDQINSAEKVYQGGHVYIVNQSIADQLVTAGYTVTQVPFTLFPDTDVYPSQDLFPGYRDLVVA